MVIQSYSMDRDSVFMQKEHDLSFQSFNTQDNKKIYFHEDIIRGLQAFSTYNSCDGDQNDKVTIPFNKATLKFFRKDLGLSSNNPVLVEMFKQKRDEHYKKQKDKYTFVQSLINYANFFWLRCSCRKIL